MVRWVWIDRQIEGEDVKELERERESPANQRAQSLRPYMCAGPLRSLLRIFFIFFSRARTRSSLSPGTDTQSKHSYSGGASEGAGERASLWKLGRELTDSRAKPTTSFSSLLK